MASSTDFNWSPGIQQALAKAVATALYKDVVTNILHPSMEQVPVKTGALRRSAVAAPPVISGNTVSVTVSYNTDYAVYVHENLTASHPHGNAKYLERPAQAAAKGMAQRIATAIRGGLT